jgi:hypothetical protein
MPAGFFTLTRFGFAVAAFGAAALDVLTLPTGFGLAVVVAAVLALATLFSGADRLAGDAFALLLVVAISASS